MLFNSWEFALFFTAVVCCYYVLRFRAQNVFLLAASYLFYGWWDWRFLGLLLISTVVDFTVSSMMAGQTARRRKLLLLISLCTNLGILGFFKYFNFFSDSLLNVFNQLGLTADWPTLHIILPVGISFYTFQTMAYTIDVYRNKLEPTHDPITFALYVAFFPQLVAGPIERAQRLLPQLSTPRRVSAEQVGSGSLLILIGLTRKIAIADVVASEVTNAFAHPEAMTSAQLMRGLLLFSLQIYSDFAGYSDIARGTSRLLGIDLMENFRQPYFATNITEFWRRWHISLSTWLRDYLYIPLGGNRGTRLLLYRNLFLTMLLGGLWHGAAWTFVVWGAIHGVALVAHKILGGSRIDRTARPSASPTRLLRQVAGWMVTMFLVVLAWAFFRAPDATTALEYITHMLSFDGGLSPRELTLPIGVLSLTMLIDIPQLLQKSQTPFLVWPWPLRGLVYAGLVLTIVLFRSGDEVPFIYFQF